MDKMVAKGRLAVTVQESTGSFVRIIGGVKCKDNASLGTSQVARVQCVRSMYLCQDLCVVCGAGTLRLVAEVNNSLGSKVHL